MKHASAQALGTQLYDLAQHLPRFQQEDLCGGRVVRRKLSRAAGDGSAAYGYWSCQRTLAFLSCNATRSEDSRRIR